MKYRIYFKNQREMSVDAERLLLTRSGHGPRPEKLLNISVLNPKGNLPMYINPSEVVAIIQVAEKDGD